MRAIWKGAVSFGLVNVPVRLFAATQEHDIRFHQVHKADGGRIRMRRICSVDGEEVAWDDLAKGYESADGRLVILTEEDFAGLPLATGREIDVVEFVPVEQVDPILFGRTYYLEPEARAAKPYVLLREALEATQRLAVVKVALRQRESLAVLRVRDKVIIMQTLMWPDEVREPAFDILETDVDLRPQELAMAQSLIESLSADFQPDAFEDEYAKALGELVDAKLEGAAPAPVTEEATASTEVVDLLTALQRSVERARSARGEGSDGGGEAAAVGDGVRAEPARPASKGTKSTKSASTDTGADTGAGAAKAPAKKAATKAPAKAPAAAKAPAKKAAAKTPAKTAAKSTAKKASPRKSA